MRQNRFLTRALHYAAHFGWPVFPVTPREKKPPLIKDWQKLATADETQIRQWWKEWPEANIAVPTGRFFWSLDIDKRSGGYESLAKLVEQHERLNNTLQQNTGGGGRQYLFENPDQQVIGNRTGLWPGIDVKGEGGYIIVPPSIHPSGKPYEWDGLYAQFIAPANPWLLEAIANGNHKPAIESFRLPISIPESQRNTTLFRLGCSLWNGENRKEVFATLAQANLTRCEVPLASREVDQIARSVLKQDRSQTKRPQTLQLPEPDSVDQILDAQIQLPEPLIKNLLPRAGLALMTGAQRSGKTIFAAQLAIALATNEALFKNYQLCANGPAIIFEKDDPGGLASFKDLYLKAPVKRGTPIDYYGKDKIPLSLGPQFLDWLNIIIPRRGAVLVVLDSYTALRPERKPGGDIVRIERDDIAGLDELAKRLGCLILLLHHESITTRANGTLDWDARGAGTYGMSMAAECQIAIARYRDLQIDAPERLVRFRSRHMKEHQATLAYNAKTGLYEHVLDGDAAALYPLIRDIKRSIDKTNFEAKELEQPLGISRPTAFRYVAALVAAEVLWPNRGEGTYKFSPNFAQMKLPVIQ